MKTNKQSKITVKNSGFKKSRFNWSHDVNTTFRWGEIQPTQCKMIVPNSKTTMQMQSLIRLAPMVAPTFGRVKYKTYSQFVNIADVFPNFDALMSQEPKATSYGSEVPQFIPSIKLGYLSSYCFQGARATLYWVDESYYNTNAKRKAAAQSGQYSTECRTAMWSAQTANAKAMLGYLVASGYEVFTAGVDYLANNTDNLVSMPDKISFHPAVSLIDSDSNAVFTSSVANPVITLSNEGTATTDLGIRSLLPPMRNGGSFIFPPKNYDKEVNASSCDYIWEFCVTVNGDEHYYALMFEFSDFGKRLRKIIQGLGYQINVASDTDVSILPLLAEYKAYFDVFGLQLYQGWETTFCSKLIKVIENYFIPNVGSFGNNVYDLAPMPGYNSSYNFNKEFIKFMLVEMSNQFYTEDADYIGAHMSSLSVSPVVDKNAFISVDSAGISNAHISNGGYAMTDNTYSTQQHFGTDTVGNTAPENGAAGFINNVQHGQVDAELLKRMYRWVNRNSILGREIAKILRAQGLGKYVDECKSQFIGSSDTLITISDVISQAATEQAVLGEYGGRGLQYDNSGMLSYENDAYGYWITLATIVPESGYTQGIDPTLVVRDKFGMYAPDWDAIGHEATSKEVVLGNSYITTFGTQSSPSMTFGFVPRLSRFKVCQNLVNGDFNRHNMRNTYLPYTLDKQLSYNDFDKSLESYDDSNVYHTIGVNLRKTATFEELPIAGNVWRTPTRHQWLGNFDRIFYKTYQLGETTAWEDGTEGETVIVGFSDFNEDNFLGHSIYDLQCYAPMKPIEDSYGLDDDDVGTSGVQPTNKA